MSEADACLSLGRRVSLLVHPGVAGSTGRLRHVSSRHAFILEDTEDGDGRISIRAVRLADIARIVHEESAR